MRFTSFRGVHIINLPHDPFRPLDRSGDHGIPRTQFTSPGFSMAPITWF
jgi:hypothetical protein